MASGSYESVEMEFWSDWDKDIDIPSPLRIVKRPTTGTNTAAASTHSPQRTPKRPTAATKTDFSIPSPLRIIKRPNNITKTDTRTDSGNVINIPRRSSSIYNCISSSPSDSDGGGLTIHKLRKPRPAVPHDSSHGSTQTVTDHVAEEVPDGINVTKEVKDPKAGNTETMKPSPSVDQRRQSNSIAGRASLGASGRTSIGSATGRTSIGPGGSGIPTRAPVGTSRLSAMRASTTQPSYDFLTGPEAMKEGEGFSRPPSRGGRARTPSNENLRGSTTNLPIHSATAQELNELKAEVKALKYKISSSAQEEELASLRREAELREVRRKGEEDFRKMQTAEGERKKAVRTLEEMKAEVERKRDAEIGDTGRLEKRARDAEEGRRVAEEEVEELRTEAEERVRGLERRLADEQSRTSTLQRTVQEVQQDSEAKDVAMQEVQQILQKKDAEIGALEAEVLRLKAQTGDVDTLDIIKRELSEQVTHIRTLEASNREQARELKHLRMLHKSVEVVEEEKRQLQRKVGQMEDLEQELGEARLQRQRLEDERLAWTAYLESQDGAVEFESPEALARALVQERLEAATQLEKLGRLEPALSERDDIIKALEGEKAALASQLDKANKEGGGGDVKARQRLERQRTLALKEVEYLRAQLSALDSEESTMELASYDAAKAQRITSLEEMVAAYSTEVATLHAEIASVPVTTSLKRTRDEAPDEQERLGSLTRKNRKLQDELSTAQSAAQKLTKELSVTKERLTAATAHKQTRVLELRDNPTANAEAIKMSTLNSLKEENAALVAQLLAGPTTTRSAASSKTVPLATLESAQRECRELEAQAASSRKAMARLKQVWGAKTAEFREGIASLLGWRVEFMPNGKMRVSSIFYPGTEDEERSIVFDGEAGTMKVSGGARSAFAGKIAESVKFWVRERGEIPCLLAALTLEFYEEGTRGAGA
ncbi:hypothetical protein V498_02534 [Pseudogymnoascus sp. VKM F-4517 (FW-2822)]|nr:hypothetical protein V498_02534 [Pseudogymnoascus sp. VKM F-4517 (FW-2822)]